ncbi:metallophosphoesterase [Haloarcula pelagica]|uniref:metallophosphoesterase n=1 Tax=Haloarcula pelagica TaxID=3033389 RepID=UPI0024C414E5|nr:metallophosphoesterase [Halomicroarcula sp. YJ-61-S]
MTGPIAVAGDVHLGAENADAEAFNGFLDSLLSEHEAVTELVLLGDVWDMIRRDPFGVAWESADTIDRLQTIAESIPVRLLLGNHDTYLGGLDDSRYDVAFLDDYVLEQAETTIRFVHGNAFDRLQFDALSERLSGPGDRGDIDPTSGRKDPLVATLREAVKRGHRGLRALPLVGTFAGVDAGRYSRRQRRAHAFLDSIAEHKLVYGHTHSPYVHHDNVAANPGSWKSTAPVHNTYLLVEDGVLELYRYRDSGADERLG